MKLKNLASMCREAGSIRLYDVPSEPAEQWCGTTAAVYPLRGLPYLEMENVTTIFELTDKQLEKIACAHEQAPESMSFEDCCTGELPVNTEDIVLTYGGTALKAVIVGENIWFLQNKFLAPLFGSFDDVQLFLRRTESGFVYFAAKAGLLLEGLIMPYNPTSETFAAGLKRIAAGAERAWLKRARGEASANE